MDSATPGIGSRIKHPEFGTGVVIQVSSDFFEIVFMDYGRKSIARSFNALEVIDRAEPDDDLISYEKVEKSIVKILRRFADIQETVEMGTKWRGGRIIFEPGNQKLQQKEMPIDAFFHKVVMVRDRLRVMEQRINASNLNDEEKINLQQYITRIYGSLTSFNLLFEHKTDHFVGEKES